ncbi:hypothetical protein LPB144_04840 [Christiangramia salexigens]|uniref:Protein-glutamine gamma-glutamyltransferase-like C-terminal domain-containing protein n=2 Tax=Christiangramia salexigens TaxID=1913577 RepID=A0A1L3J3V3_9FLAO|nr:hypothetical protein LPB144_04840 [Christiangramia salexigens]
MIFCGYSQQADSLYPGKNIEFKEKSQLTPVKFDEKYIQELKEQDEFNYLKTEEKDSWWTRFKKYLNARYNQFINWLFGDYQPNSIIGFIISIFPYIILGVLIGLIIWFFSKLDPGKHILQSPNEPQVFLSEEEELIKNEDLEGLIQDAINNEEFRLAIRYQYLNELRRLDELNWIDYQFQKTNRDYFQEIKKESIRNKFSEITKLYEFIWYGSFEVSKRDYALAEKGFLQMEQLLKAVHHE